MSTHHKWIKDTDGFTLPSGYGVICDKCHTSAWKRTGKYSGVVRLASMVLLMSISIPSCKEMQLRNLLK